MEVAKKLIDTATGWRRHIHSHPELGYQETRTSDYVAQLLESFGLEVHRGLGGTGVVGTLRNGDGPAIGLRADMDALPIQELARRPHASTHSGCMHACGHDGHTSILLAAASYLSEHRDFQGTVYFVFQPAEETGAGARKMIDEGLFEHFPMQAIYGLHNWPGLAAGKVAINPGAMMASMDTFEVHLTGAGCHAAMPENGVDPIIAAAHLVVALQTLVSRRISPLDSAVISVTRLHAGEAINVIPETAVLHGTLRALRKEVRESLEQRICELSEQLPASLGVKANVTFRRGYPVTTNHLDAALAVQSAAQKCLGAENVQWGTPPSMGSEDFAFMLEHCPGAYFWLGVDSEKSSTPLHNPYYDFNDEVIELGVRVWIQLVRESLPSS